MRRIAALFVFLALSAALGSCKPPSVLTTADGVSVAYEHEIVPGAKGTVVLVHGLGSDMGEWYTFRKALTAAGWSVLALDVRGHGMSTQWRDGEIDWREMGPEAGRTAVQDLRAAAEYLRDEKTLWFAGSSFGANLSLRYAAMDPSVDGVVLMTPGTSYLGVEAAPALLDYGARPVLITAASGEPGAVKVAEWLLGQAPGPKKLLTGEEGHGSGIIEYHPDLGKEIIAWMEQNTAAGQKNTSV